MNLTNKQSKYLFLPIRLISSLNEYLKIIEREDITYVAHGIKRNGVRTCFFSHNHWGNTFISQRLYQDDPFTIMAEETKAPFIFWEEVDMNLKEKEIDLWRKDACNIHTGLTFSNHCYDFHEILALGTSRKLLDIKSLALNKGIHCYLSQLLSPIRYAHFAYRYKEQGDVSQ